MGLDPRARALVFETIRALNREQGHTVLLVEQNARAGLQIAHPRRSWTAGGGAVEGEAAGLLGDPKVAELYLGGHVRSAPSPAHPSSRRGRLQDNPARAPTVTLRDVARLAASTGDGVTGAQRRDPSTRQRRDGRAGDPGGAEARLPAQSGSRVG